MDRMNLMWGCRGLLWLLRRSLAARYGRAFAAAVGRQYVREFERLIPQIPYIGGRANRLTGNLVGTVYCLAFYRAMVDHGRSTDEIGQFIYDTFARMLRWHPRPLSRLLRRVRSKSRRRRARERVRESLRRTYVGDWAYEWVEGDGEAFDYGIDYTECGIVKFLSAQGAEDLAPYMCALDDVMLPTLGLELRRTTTLAEGGERCDFRLKRV